MSALVNEVILENKGTFENKWVNNIYEYGVYGKTIRHKLYASDKKERYFYLYHSISKESAERIEIENRINQMTQYLKKYQNKVKDSALDLRSILTFIMMKRARLLYYRKNGAVW